MLSFFANMAAKHGGITTHFNPVALRKAKIVCNFGLSECNRLKLPHWMQTVAITVSFTLCRVCDWNLKFYHIV